MTDDIHIMETTCNLFPLTKNKIKYIIDEVKGKEKKEKKLISIPIVVIVQTIVSP